MVCPFCNSETRVTNSRHNKRDNHVWRRRECQRCRAIFTTRETIDFTASVVYSTNTANIEPFRREKLFVSIYECCKHLQKPEESAEALTATIISRLTRRTSGNVSRTDVITHTVRVLKRFNGVAAMQYRALHPL